MFISYSRHDADVARRLHAALISRGKDIWIDWEDIPPTAVWWNEITAAIDRGHSFVVILTQKFLSSQVCARELEHAATNRKRLIPVVAGASPNADVPETLKPINWLFVPAFDTNPGAFESFVDELIRVIDTDLEHVRSHTRSLVRAREWEARGRDASYLLRGKDLRDAELWLVGSAEKPPEPTPLQRAYVLASRQSSTRRQRTAMAGVLAALVLTSVLAVMAYIKGEIARERQHEAEVQTTIAKTQTAEAQRQKHEADRQTSIALSRQFAAEADTLPQKVATGLPTAVLLAAEGLERSPTPEAQNALRRLLHLLPHQIAHLAYLALNHDNDSARTHHDGVYLSYLALLGRSPNDATWAFSPSGKLVAGSFTSGSIVGNDIPCTVEIMRLDLPSSWQVDLTGTAIQMIFSADDRMLIIAGYGGMLHGISLDNTGSWHWNIEQPINDRWRLLFDAQSGQVVSIGSRTLAWIDPITGDVTRQSPPLKDEIGSCAMSADGRLFAVASHAGVVLIDGIGMKTLTTITSEDISENIATFLTFSADGQRLAIGGLQGAKVVDINSERVVGKVRIMDDGIYRHLNQIALSPDGTLLVTAESHHFARLWDIASGQERFRVSHDAGLRSVTFSPDGQSFATVGDDDTVRLWNTESGNELRRCTHSDFALWAAFSRDGATLATVGMDGVRVWDLRGAEETATMHGSIAIEKITYSTDGLLIASAARDNTVTLWDAASGTQLFRVQNPTTRNNSASYLIAFSPDHSMLAVHSEDDTVYIWDTTTGALRSSFGPVTDEQFLVFNADGTRLATFYHQQYRDNTRRPKAVTIWETGTGRRIARIPTSEHVQAVAFSVDSQSIACHWLGGPIAIIALPGGDLLHKVDLAEKPVSAPADDAFLKEINPTASGGDALAKWELLSARLTRIIPPEDRYLSDWQVCPNSTLAIVGRSDSTTRIYDLVTGAEVKQLSTDSGSYTEQVFSPSGSLLASVSNNARKLKFGLRVLHMPDAEEVFHLDFPSAVSPAAFSPDERHLAVGCADGKVRVFMLKNDELIAEARRRVGHGFSPEETARYLKDAAPSPGISPVPDPERH